MMKDILINVSRQTRLIYLTDTTIGVDNENLQAKLVFKFTDEFVNGTARLEYILDDEKHWFLLEKEGESYTCPLKNVLLKEGRIDMQLVITESETEAGIPVFKSNMFYVRVNNAINAESEAPEGYEQWLDIANAKLAEIDNSISEANAAGNFAKETANELQEKVERGDFNGKDALINGENTITIQEGQNIEIEQNEGVLTINNTYSYDDTLLQTEINSVNEIAQQNTRDIQNVDNKTTALNNELQEQEETLNHLADTKQDKINDLSAIRSNAQNAIKQIKTINNQSLLGTGNIEIKSGGGSNYNELTNKPLINDIMLEGSMTSHELGLLDDTDADTIIKYVDDADNVIRERIAEIELFKFPNMIIHGEPTINNGQVSDFTTDNYLSFPAIFDLHDRGFEFNFAFRTGGDTTTAQNIIGSKYCMALFIQNSKINLRVSQNGTDWSLVDIQGNVDIQPNTTYYVQIYFDKLTYKLRYSLDGQSYTDIASKVASVSPKPSQIYLGVGNNFHNPFGGIINLNKCYLKVNNSVVWAGMDTAGLETRADLDLSNISSEGEQRIKDLASEIIVGALEADY